MFNTAYLTAKDVARRVLGIEVFRRNTPWGLSLRNDLHRLCPSLSIDLIFDIGANEGQTAELFTFYWPVAQIFSFEPVPDTFSQLTARTRHLSNVAAYNIGFSSEPKSVNIHLPTDSRLASLDKQAAFNASTTDIPVTLDTLDLFCVSHSINSINLLKIDTEGHDMNVLIGASHSLSSSIVDAIVVEAGSMDGPGKIGLGEISKYLRTYNFHCIGVYDQCFWPKHSLYYGNACFVHSRHLPPV
ncbi:FkbM family methyltransferase [Rubinisphaera sp. JC750]|uniref:FkbM family methyltransferase n=1 Tax=Rubinisphaera sp. JC750 TaxID=2898658 RepID=UPI00396583C3